MLYILHNLLLYIQGILNVAFGTIDESRRFIVSIWVGEKVIVYHRISMLDPTNQPHSSGVRSMVLSVMTVECEQFIF